MWTQSPEAATECRNEMERPNNENEAVTRPSLNDLPDEILRTIIMSLRSRECPPVEVVCQRFHLCFLECWKSVKTVRLEEFCDNALVFWKGESEKLDLLQDLLRMIYDRSPNVQSISGFETFVSELDSRTLEYLTHFENLKSVTFSNCKMTTAGLATFLNDSKNRTQLEELCIIESLTFSTSNMDSSHETKLLLQSLLNTPDRPALRLRKFRYKENDCCEGFFLVGLDTSRLKILSLADSMINWECVTELLGRCIKLQEFRFDGVDCSSVEVDPETEKAFFNAVVSLPTINLRRLELCNCTLNDGLLSAILGQLGLRHDRLESLCIRDNVFQKEDRIAPVIGECFSNLTTLRIDVASVGKDDLAQLMTRMGRLKELAFYYSDPFSRASRQNKERIVDADVVRAIASNVTGLTSLRLYEVVITPENAEMLTQMNELQEVCIRWTAVNVEALTWWCERFGPMITCLEIYSLMLTDSLILRIVNRLTRVRRLLLGANLMFTDTALYSIAVSCRNMEELLVGCVAADGLLMITASGVQAVMDNCKKLAYVELCKTAVEMEGIVMNKGTRMVCGDDIFYHLFPQ